MSKGISKDSKIKMEISEVMTSTVHTIFPDESVKSAAKLMLQKLFPGDLLEPGITKAKPTLTI